MTLAVVETSCMENMEMLNIVLDYSVALELLGIQHNGNVFELRMTTCLLLVQDSHMHPPYTQISDHMTTTLAMIIQTIFTFILRKKSKRSITHVLMVVTDVLLPILEGNATQTDADFL